MDKHSWPWKKKSSEKRAASTDASGTQDETKTGNYVQISVETYDHLIKLEEKVKVLNEKLASSQSEITAKDDIVKQHAKVAEDAIAGWEKAEEETLALKNQLEDVTLLKLTAEDRASHLDGALKECMKQVRNVKEEGEQKLHDTILAKTRQWEKVKSELEAKLVDFEQEFLRSSAENDALSRSLQEHANALARISDEKAQAYAEIEGLKSDIQSCEREINSLKYEVHLVSKELEIRNEEKNMSVKLAETANRQHLEDVKKITKLEAETQRLRGLVRKKLPGPAALAQMKLEVENLGGNYGDVRSRTSARSSSPYASPPNFSYENMQQCYKGNEYLTARLLEMEEENKMLKEVLSKRNSELQASRNICSTMASKLRSIEENVPRVNQQKSNPSVTSMSEDGIDEEGSCSGSCAVTLIPESSQFKKEKDVGRSNKAGSSKNLELMDDFLEMERWACSPTETNDTTTVSNGGMGKATTEISDDTLLNDVEDLKSPKTLPHDEEQIAVLLSKLQSEIASLFEAQVLESDVGRKLLEDIKRIIMNKQDELSRHPNRFINEETDSVVTRKEEQCSKEMGEAEDLRNAISNIHDFVILLCKEAAIIRGRSNDDHGLREKIQKFSASMNKSTHSDINLDDFIFALSHMLSETRDVRFVAMTNTGSEGESNSNDFIDKLTLLEKTIAQQDPTKAKLSEECVIPATSSGPGASGFELAVSPENCTLEQFAEMKQEKDHMATELARCTEALNHSKLQLVEMEQQLAEHKSQLAACQKSNSLAETQLKCMAESYNSLESKTQGLQTEINLLRSKTEALENELREERHDHEEDLAKYKDLQEEIERGMKCSVCSSHSATDVNIKTKQEREIAAAAEKLAECQESIFLLSMQLKDLHPPAEPNGSSPSAKPPNHNDYRFPEAMHAAEQSGGASTDNDDAASVVHRTEECDSYVSDEYSSLFRPCVAEPAANGKPAKHRSKSASSSSLSSVLNEKHPRGFSRFFSKGKSER
ncbi:filament-like plant protein 4 [Iris pallida]|uniref:Filament-like plant protein 4 n=1 Tax=Iris pallida TaxID=29817 RepID=A0AAX6FT55_IRIPA|nr:filament-like plant protein 4 [Iris pallida]